jgi:hypothetical protein
MPGSTKTTITELGFLAVIAGILTVLLQIHLGAYRSELGYDECSHYISGLLIHDYLVSGFSETPITFLRNFASAYPLVGIGHWGPFWYLVEAFWMLLFGWDLTSIMVFSALTTVVIAAILYVVAAKPLGRFLAAFAALAFVCSPIVQVSSASVMLDGAITLICLLAAMAWFRYTETLDYRFSIAFGVLAAIGLLTKGNAGCLALIPPISVLLDRNWGIMRRTSFWVPAAIVLLIAGPWTLITYHQVSQGFRFGWGWPYTSVAVAENFRSLVTADGPLLLAFVPLGIIPLFKRDHSAVKSLSKISFALLAAVLVFQCIVPAAIQDRYLEPAIPPLLLLAALGIHQISQRSTIRYALAGIATLAALPWITNAAIKQQYGLREAVKQIWLHSVPGNPSVLIVADGGAEGAAVAEIAMHDKARPSMFAVRGSRLLGAGGYNSQDYQARFKDPQLALNEIDQYAIPLVLVRRDRSRREWAHVAQIDLAHELQPERWQVIYQNVTGTTSVALYRLAGNADRKADINRLKRLTGPRAL